MRHLFVSVPRGGGEEVLRVAELHGGGNLVRFETVSPSVVAAVFSWLMRQETATAAMVSVSEISSATVLLPLAAGAAGALNLVQSERSSLVSRAAVSVLVAASLAPPAGIIGMGAALGEWNIARSGGFLLILQLAGINIAGSLVFRSFGLSPQGVRYERGRNGVFSATLTVSLVILAGLLWLQLSHPPELQRAAAAIQRIVNDSGVAAPVEANVRFTRADISGQNTMLAVVYVQRMTSAPVAEVRGQLARAIQRRLQQEFNVTPLVALTVLDADEPN